MRGVMGKYTHLNEDEIISHIEKFGTDDEREIISTIRPKMHYEDCPHCEDKDDEVEVLKDKIFDAVKLLS